MRKRVRVIVRVRLQACASVYLRVVVRVLRVHACACVYCTVRVRVIVRVRVHVQACAPGRVANAMQYCTLLHVRLREHVRVHVRVRVRVREASWGPRLK